jgi:hypothetical protein
MYVDHSRGAPNTPRFSGLHNLRRSLQRRHQRLL